MNEQKKPTARIRSDAEFYAAVWENYQHMQAKEEKRRMLLRSATLLLLVCLVPLALFWMPGGTGTPSTPPAASEENGLPEPVAPDGLCLSYGQSVVEILDAETVASLYAALLALGSPSTETAPPAQTSAVTTHLPREESADEDIEGNKPEGLPNEAATAAVTTVENTRPTPGGEVLSPDENTAETDQREYTLTFAESGVTEVYLLSGRYLYRIEGGRRILLRVLSDAEFAALTTRLSALMHAN